LLLVTYLVLLSIGVSKRKSQDAKDGYPTSREDSVNNEEGHGVTSGRAIETTGEGPLDQGYDGPENIPIPIRGDGFTSVHPSGRLQLHKKSLLSRIDETPRSGSDSMPQHGGTGKSPTLPGSIPANRNRSIQGSGHAPETEHMGDHSRMNIDSKLFVPTLGQIGNDNSQYLGFYSAQNSNYGLKSGFPGSNIATGSIPETKLASDNRTARPSCIYGCVFPHRHASGHTQEVCINCGNRPGLFV
jgi:hypothetical protein